jgi:hypothetical protein
MAGGEPMTAKQYLRQYLDADREINAKLEQLSKLRAMAEKVTTAFGDNPHHGKPQGQDNIGDIVARIVDMSRDIDDKIDRLASIKQDVEAAIDSVDNATLRTLLQYRYICDWTWERIAVQMGYTYRNITYLHGKALVAIDIS